MDSKPIAPLKVNNIPNAKSPITPLVHIEGDMLVWNPIEYIGRYEVLRNGNVIATTRSTTYRMTEPGEYQVIGISEEGIPSFASEPVSTALTVITQMPGRTPGSHRRKSPECIDRRRRSPAIRVKDLLSLTRAQPR